MSSQPELREGTSDPDDLSSQPELREGTSDPDDLSSQPGAERRERATHQIWRALAYFVGALPFGWLRALGAFLGWLAGSVLRIRRAHVDAAMRRAGVPPAAAAMYRGLGASAFEFLWLAGRARHVDELDHLVAMDDASRVAWMAAGARGRGIVVAASHTGNWDLTACAMARRGPVLVVTKRLSMKGLDAFWQSTRARYGVSLVEARGALQHAREALRGGSAVAMMIDQVPARRERALRCEFLGAAALVDRAPAILAMRAGAPLVVTASRRMADGTQRIDVLRVLDPPRARGGERTSAWIDDATRAANDALDAFVRAHPSEWLWLHRRWKDVEPANDAARTTVSQGTYPGRSFPRGAPAASSNASRAAAE